MGNKISFYARTIVRGFIHYRKNRPLLLAGATSFFTTFSLPPITILVVNLLSFYFFRADLIRTNLFRELENTFGKPTADQISTIAGNFRQMADNTIYTILGTIFLAFVATTLFYVVQSAIHQIWSIRHNDRRKIKHQLIQRGISLLMIVVASILMLLTLFAETALTFVGEYAGEMYPGFNEVLVTILSSLVSLLVYSIWFAILFRFLPDARIPFSTAWKGGLFTGILFTAGKYLLSMLLETEQMGNLFGASASIMILLLFIFYSSMIIYFGASFTYVLLLSKRQHLRTKKYSEHIPE